jgi:hypothetical protein
MSSGLGPYFQALQSTGGWYTVGPPDFGDNPGRPSSQHPMVAVAAGAGNGSAAGANVAASGGRSQQVQSITGDASISWVAHLGGCYPIPGGLEAHMPTLPHLGGRLKLKRRSRRHHEPGVGRNRGPRLTAR